MFILVRGVSFPRDYGTIFTATDNSAVLQSSQSIHYTRVATEDSAARSTITTPDAQRGVVAATNYASTVVQWIYALHVSFVPLQT